MERHRVKVEILASHRQTLKTIYDMKDGFMKTLLHTASEEEDAVRGALTARGYKE